MGHICKCQTYFFTLRNSFFHKLYLIFKVGFSINQIIDFVIFQIIHILKFLDFFFNDNAKKNYKYFSITSSNFFKLSSRASMAWPLFSIFSVRKKKGFLLLHIFKALVRSRILFLKTSAPRLVF